MDRRRLALARYHRSCDVRLTRRHANSRAAWGDLLEALDDALEAATLDEAALEDTAPRFGDDYGAFLSPLNPTMPREVQ